MIHALEETRKHLNLATFAHARALPSYRALSVRWYLYLRTLFSRDDAGVAIPLKFISNYLNQNTVRAFPLSTHFQFFIN